MPQGVTYARLSEVQKGVTDGIERQQRELDAFAERLGVDIVDRLVDNDLTAAKKVRRPDFQRLMTGIAANEWDVVVLRSLDRWVRRPAELEQIIEVVEKSKVRVEAVHGTIDLRTRAGRLNARVVTAVAMSEVEAIQERVTDWHADRAARGVALHSRPGRGFRKVDGRMVHHPGEVAQIRDAARRLIEGESLASIGREWGVRAQQVRQTMLAPRIAGLRVHQGATVGEAEWEPILDRVTWERVKAVLNRTRAPASTKMHLLTGIVSCHRCKSTLNCAPHNGTLRYHCRRCKAVRIVAKPLEDHVARHLFAEVDRHDLDLTPDVDAEAVAVRVLGLEADLAALADTAGEGHITLAEWKIARVGIERRLAEARSELVMPPVREWAGQGSVLAAEWDAMSVDERRRVVAAWLPVIEIGPAVVGRTTFDADRVQLAAAHADRLFR